MERLSPRDRYSDVPVTPAAFLPVVTISSRLAFSSASSVVITLVVDAIGRRWSAFCANKIRPESASIRTAPFAATRKGSDADAGIGHPDSPISNKTAINRLMNTASGKSARIPL